MAYIFGDGFDCYAAPADAVAGYWDSGNTGFTLTAGRFAGSQAIQCAAVSATIAQLLKNSGSNDGVHHIALAVQQGPAISGTTIYPWFTLSDGATAQCSVVFRSDGAILLTAGAANGTVLATYTGALTASNTWYQFEIEIRVSNTAGYMNVRKLGNTTNDFASATNLDTSANANDYANRLSYGSTTSAVFLIDDLLWRSDSVANGVPWVGDIRCFTRRPASDAAVQWTPSGTSGVTQSFGGATTFSISNSVIRFTPYTVTYSGSITSVTIVTASLAAGNMKAAIWADNAGVPGAVLASLASQATVAGGNNVFTLGTPLAVTPGQKIWVGALDDTSTGNWSTASGGQAPYNTNSVTASGSFATFPQANPTPTTAQASFSSAITYGLSGNWSRVAEPTQDSATTYNYSSNVGDSDLYGISAIGSTPASIVAVTTRAYLQKSDAGTRNTSVQLKSGGATVSSASAALNTVFSWQYRTDTTDPATGAAWTAVGVANAQIGVVVTA